MRICIRVIAALLPCIATPAIADDFEAACIDARPDGESAEQVRPFCSCLAAATSENDDTRAALVASWPVEGDPEAWLGDLDANAAAVVESCNR